MFDDKVSRRLFGPNRNEVTREWRRLHDEELNGMQYFSGDQIEKNLMGGHEASIKEGRDIRVYTKYWWGNLRERDHLEDRDVDGMIILRSIFRKLDVGAWIVSSWLKLWTDGGYL